MILSTEFKKELEQLLEKHELDIRLDTESQELATGIILLLLSIKQIKQGV